MPYKVLARKWRPQVFQDVIGQEHVTQTLINAINSDRLAHAYLFGGPRGVGKTSVARILAKAINCEQGTPGIPCNKCLSCVEITGGSSVDVQEIDGASNRGIDEIRELRENIKYMPASSRYRIYIIDEVHMLTLPAFNALLKTLEEPPSHVKFIFATTESHKVPVTILSRCQRFDFKRISMRQIMGQLGKITSEEGIEISESALALIAREAEGSMRDAESLLDQVISFTGSAVEDKHVIDILGIIDRDIVFDASRAITQGAPKACLDIVEQIYNFGYDIKEFYRALMDQFRNLLIILISPQDHLLEMSEHEKKEALQQAESAGLEKLQIMLNFLIIREEALRFTSHPRLILEAAMIKLCHLDDFLSFGDLLIKVESLEKRLAAPSGGVEHPDTRHLSDPGAPWVSKSQDTGQGHGNKESQKDQARQTWNDFLAFLSSKSKAIFNVLKDWQMLRLTEKTLEIAKGNRSFSSSFFDDPERHDKLSKYCRDFFQRNMLVKIVDNNTHASPQQKRSSGKRHLDLSPPIKDIVHMFQGEVEEGHPVEKNGENKQKERRE
jgi:DNA polymerase-3 subunit gamma/tau